MGHPILGDKLYPDPGWMLEFLKDGFSPRLEAALELNRQALHALDIVFESNRKRTEYHAPLTPELVAYCRERMGVEAEDYLGHR
jgi:23S rRNA-/tRNA-specific pseudouridylate synthase